MRYAHLFLVGGMALAAMVTSCTSEQETPEVDITAVRCNISRIDVEEDFATGTLDTLSATRGTFSGVNFLWSEGDKIGIVPTKGAQIYFSVNDGAGTSSALFEGGDWAMKSTGTFYAYYPLYPDIFLSKDHVSVSYTGQVQSGNNNNLHTGNYWTLYTNGTTAVGNTLNFTFDHLTSFFKTYVTVPAGTYTKITFSAPSEVFIKDGYFDLGAHPPVIEGTTFTDELCLDLQNVTFTEETELTGYLVVAPVDITGIPITVTVYRDGEAAYEYTVTKESPMVAAKTYGFHATTLTPIPSGDIPNYLSFSALEEGCSVSLVRHGYNSPNLEFSYDCLTWTNWNYDSFSSVQLPLNQPVYFRGDNSSGFSMDKENYSNFWFSGRVAASGNIQSLLYGAAFEDYLTIPNDYCFYQLFINCRNLTTAPELPATSLTSYCYGLMFEGCIGLNSAPELPAMSLAPYCYYCMFHNCRIESAPDLPAISLAEHCYDGMFYSCENLVIAPELPATSLAEHCYAWMFSACKNLVIAPDLPATSLAEHCYKGMFTECTSLTDSPLLPAQELAPYCYDRLFYGCSSLKHIEALFTTTPSSTYTSDWVNGVARTGTFVKNTNATWNVRGVDGIPELWMAEPGAQQPLTFTSHGQSMISLEHSLNAFHISIDYKKGDDEWMNYEGGSVITLNDGESVSFKSNGTRFLNSTSDTWRNYYFFKNSGAGTLSVSGCVISLIDPTIELTNLGEGQCFHHLFANMASLIDASRLILPASLYDYCFASMFENCVNLAECPVLEATELSKYCYSEMFRGCTSLLEGPTLPATVLADYCYNLMFSGCTSLEAAPLLPATSLADYCYDSMFSGCTNLIDAPSLPATTITVGCYNFMFGGCTSLTNAPELPATTLYGNNCYSSMFSGCTALVNAPELPATSLSNQCYTQMFFGCTSLRKAPEILPATILARDCYSDMFYGCTSLLTAPVLPATTLVSGCYINMFRGCSNLNYIKALFYGEPNPGLYYTKNWVDGVAETGVFEISSNATWYNSFSGHGTDRIPIGWTVQTAVD